MRFHSIDETLGFVLRLVDKAGREIRAATAERPRLLWADAADRVPERLQQGDSGIEILDRKSVV